jgi:pimeloyl-ACP methyl ester carboxylesterase
VALHADDAAAILRAVGDEPAYVYGNSGGGTIGLELVARHSELVGTFVAHEAPVIEVLPDATRWRSEYQAISETYRTDGIFPAMEKFGALVEEGGPKYSEEMQRRQPTQEDQEMMARMAGNFDLFIAHEIQQITGYEPDVDALRNVSTRIVSAAGETSGEQAARRAAAAPPSASALQWHTFPADTAAGGRILGSSPGGWTSFCREDEDASFATSPRDSLAEASSELASDQLRNEPAADSTARPCNEDSHGLHSLPFCVLDVHRWARRVAGRATAGSHQRDFTGLVV